MSTLLRIAQDAAQYIGLGKAQLSTVIGNNDIEAQKILAMVNASGRRIARAHPWTVLIVIDNPITLVSDQADYAMPSDFDRFLPDTQWDQTNDWRVGGAVQPPEWRYRKDAIDTSSHLRRAFRRNGSTVTIDPTPSTGGDVLTFPYVSANWCQSAGGAGQSEWLANDDEPIIDAELLELDLRWRLLSGRQPNAEEKEEFERVFYERKAQDLALGRLRMRGGDAARDPRLRNLPQAATPESGFDSGFGS